MALLVNRTMSLLDAESVDYQILPHEPDYTAQETARHTHTSGWDFAKVVVIVTGDGYACVVLPAPRKLDPARAERHCRKPVRLVAEDEMALLFPDCEVGAEPPFGNLYALPVYVSPELAAHERITFNAGTHRDAVRMRYRDFERLVRPAVLDLAEHG